MQENLTTEIPLPTHPSFINRTGHVYGRLTVRRYTGKRLGFGHIWECDCECGKATIVYGSNLGRNTNSCGCLSRESRLVHSTTHGKRYAPIYNIWCKIIRRCTKPLDKGYPYYGGRGITVCERWRRFEDFYADMGDRPPLLSIDRVDNNGGYWCGKCDECATLNHLLNCRWATKSEQMVNRRTTRFLTYNGRTVNIAQWAREVGISRGTITGRLNAGWTVEDALTMPILPNDKSRRGNARHRMFNKFE